MYKSVVSGPAPSAHGITGSSAKNASYRYTTPNSRNSALAASVTTTPMKVRPLGYEWSADGELGRTMLDRNLG